MPSLEDRVLEVAARRGSIGVQKTDYFREIRGIGYATLEEAITELESKGLIRVEWMGFDKFMVFITSEGSDALNSHMERRTVEAKA